MSKIYARACEKQGKNFNTVPARIADDVREIIESDGYIINDDGTVEKRPIN